MRKVPFVKGEYYHLYNRGVDKRTVIEDKSDLQRVYISLHAFNSPEPTGSIYEKFFAKKESPLETPMSKWSKKNKLIDVIAYCFLPNHYHLVVSPVADEGVSKFMQKFGIGYTNYFNEKYGRSGSLFQGKFKSVHISTNEQLLHVGAYVNLNYKVHQFGNRIPKLVKSSHEEYLRNKSGVCNKSIVLKQFRHSKEYKNFAEETVENVRQLRRQKQRYKTGNDNENKIDTLLLE